MVLVLALAAGLWWNAGRRGAPPVAPSAGGEPKASTEKQDAALKPGATPRRVRPGKTPTAAEKAAQVERIKRDYDEIRAKTAADYTAAGTSFPGGLNAFLRQLALLERALHEDLAALLTPRELEDVEMRDTTAGQLVQRLLGDTAASEEQRREVFRVRRSFEDQFALTFDLTPPALYARESARLANQEKIRAILGDALFAAWLRGEGTDFAQITDFVARQGLPPDAALNLWRARNEFTTRRLELAARSDLSVEQRRLAQDLMLREAEVRVGAVLGPGAMEVAKQEVLNWLPRK